MQPPEKVYLIDTNVILRYLLNDHKRFSPIAKAFMQDVAKGLKKAELQSVVIVECVYVMEKFYEIPKDEIVDKLSRILNIKGIVNPDKSEILAALVKYENSSADIVDCMLAAKSSPQSVIVSFDKDFKRLKAICEKLWVIAVNSMMKAKIDVPINEPVDLWDSLAFNDFPAERMRKYQYQNQEGNVNL